MQAGTELTLSSSSISDFQDEFAVTKAKISEEFSWKMKLNGSDGDRTEKSAPSDEEVGEDDEEFSFACTGADGSPISADDVFQDGQIKPIYPWFDQSILFAGDSKLSQDDLRRRPPVNKVFFEAENSSAPLPSTEVDGPYCAWSGKAVDASPEICKKSNSTGFSKLWRFRDLLNRSNSDGRDAFVFLNGSATASSKKDENAERSERSSEKKSTGEAKTNGGGAKVKAKKGKKGKPASLSAHELHYVRNRALREEDRRRSYLPYRPELFGFFTNVQGGLSRNVHPY